MNFHLSDLLPHRPPMLLITGVKSCDKQELISQVQITDESFGSEHGAVPSWFGIEYMAQSVSAYNALQIDGSGNPQIGFLVGVRGYRCSMVSFKSGILLNVHVRPILIAENSGSFECEIESMGEVVGRATITTYMPSADGLQKIKQGRIDEF